MKTWEIEAGGPQAQGQSGLHSKTVSQKQKKKTQKTRHWWLTSVIPATWEADIRRIEVQGQPGQKVFKTPSPK
jgi:hypothetical protein